MFEDERRTYSRHSSHTRSPLKNSDYNHKKNISLKKNFKVSKCSLFKQKDDKKTGLTIFDSFPAKAYLPLLYNGSLLCHSSHIVASIHISYCPPPSMASLPGSLGSNLRETHQATLRYPSLWETIHVN